MQVFPPIKTEKGETMSELTQIQHSICSHPAFPFGNGEIQVIYTVEQANAIDDLTIRVFDLPYSLQFNIHETGYGTIVVDEWYLNENKVWVQTESFEGDSTQATEHILDEIMNGYY